MLSRSSCSLLLLVCCACHAPDAPPPATPSAPPSNTAASAPATTSPPPPAAPTPAPAAPEPPVPAVTPTLAAPPVPAALAVPADAKLILAAKAKGVQIYQCGAKKGEPSAFEWTLKAPEAVLVNDQGAPVAKHFAGPTWQATDGSKITGQLVTKADAPDADAIPWLLLSVKSQEGSGLFSHVSHVQRLSTSGGKAPATGCDAKHPKAEQRVDYSATYYFYESTQR